MAYEEEAFTVCKEEACSESPSYFRFPLGFRHASFCFGAFVHRLFGRGIEVPDYKKAVGVKVERWVIPRKTLTAKQVLDRYGR